MKKLLLLLLPFLFISCMPLMHDLESGGTVTITDNPEESKLTASYSGSETVAYQWYKNGMEISGETSTTFTYDVETMGGDVLSVKVTDNSNKTYSSKSLTVISGSVTLFDDSQGSMVAIYTGDIPVENFNYSWFEENEDGDFVLISGASGKSYPITLGTNYMVIITADGYCGRLKTDPEGCVIAGTMIEMGDGTFKPVEEIELGDVIKSFDFNTGTFVSNKVVCIDEAVNKTKLVFTLTAANGYSISFVDIQSFFDVNKRNFIEITKFNYESMIGKTILVKDGESFVETKIESITSKIDVVSYYEIIPEKTFRFFADGFMTVIPESLLGRPVYELLADEYKYDPVKMEQDIQTYGLYTYETCPLNVSKDFFEAYNFALLKKYVEKGYVTLEEINESINWHLGSTVKNAFKVRKD